MATHKSAIKSHRRSLEKCARNRSIKSRVKTFTNKFEATLKQGNVETIKKTFDETQSEIMKAVRKGVLKLNTGARRVSRLARLMKNSNSSL